MGHASMDQVASTHAGINDLIICPSVGMEDMNDLIEDPDFAMSFSGRAAQDVVIKNACQGMNRCLRDDCRISGDPAHSDDWTGAKSSWRKPCDGPNRGALRAALPPAW